MPEIYQDVKWSRKLFKGSKFIYSSFLIKGLKIDLVDERNGQSDTFFCENGIVEYVKDINEGKNVLYDDPILFEGEENGIRVEIAIQHTDNYNESVFSFVNNISTTDGGTHEIGFKSGLTRVLNDLARKNGNLKEKFKVKQSRVHSK